MNRIRSIAVVAGLMTVTLVPVLAQTPAPSQQAGGGEPAPNITVPSGVVQKSQNDWRARTLIGSPVFNDRRQRIATVNDILITDDGKVNQVILSASRPRGKLVAVPFNQLRFVPSTGLAAGFVTADGLASTPALSGSLKTYGIILPGATRESLTNMEAYRFSP
ncbi:MAG: PRC-barrel domain-containing protein [Acetobacteraceae bacterium]|nr:PRC-barrel domain-containing protein [Acetobacteraceae bacterium]